MSEQDGQGSKPAGSRRTCRKRGAVSVVAMLMMAASCSPGGDDDDDGGSVDGDVAGESASQESTTTAGDPSGSTTTTTEDGAAPDVEVPDDPAEAAEAVYRASVEAEAAALNPPDAEHPDLLATETGGALEMMENLVDNLESEGAALDMDVEDVVILDVNVTTEEYVRVESCEIRVIQRLVDGELDGEPRRALTLTTAGVVPAPEGDGWRVALLSQEGPGDTSDECPDPDAEDGVDDGTDRYDNNGDGG